MADGFNPEMIELAKQDNTVYLDPATNKYWQMKVAGSDVKGDMVQVECKMRHDDDAKYDPKTHGCKEWERIGSVKKDNLQQPSQSVMQQFAVNISNQYCSTHNCAKQ